MSIAFGRKLTRERFLLGIALLMVLVLVFRTVRGCMPRESLVQFADRAYEMLDEGKGEALYEYLPEYERAAMSRTQFGTMINWRNACFEGMTPHGKRIDTLQRGGFALRTGRDMERGGKVVSTMTMWFDQGPDGPLISATAIVYDALAARAWQKATTQPYLQRRSTAVAAALASELPSLNSFGSGLFFGKEFRTWRDQSIEHAFMAAFEKKKHDDPKWRATAENAAILREQIRAAYRD